MNVRPCITYNDKHLRINNVPALIQAGTLDYFRLPHPDLWPPVLHRMRAGGLNAVVVPFPWAYHSPAPGLYDFTGPRDIGHLFDAAEAAGLWLIPDVGPWIEADLPAGGLPTWFLNTPNVRPNCASPVPAGPSFPFVRYVKEWWSQLVPLFAERPNLLLIALDPGWCAAGNGLPRYTRALIGMARDLGLGDVSFTAPREHIPTPTNDTTLDEHLSLVPRNWLAIGKTPIAADAEGSFTTIETGPTFAQNSGTRQRLEVQLDTHLRDTTARLLSHNPAGYTLASAHTGVNWGYWGTSDACTATGIGAPLGEGGALTTTFFHTRQLASTAETLNATLPTTDPSAITRSHPRLLPIEWPLAGGRLLTTTLEPVLRTTVAGRHLLILTNETGGHILLSDDFRAQHARGPVRTQRTDEGLAVRFEAARWISLLLDGPDGPLQLLALNPHFASRVWPLDDAWRTTPAYPATWQPAPEDPARGLVIGPELVHPRADGGYDYLVAQKGFGYRWGPWRGSDPRTWLAPITWRDPPPVELPELTWASRAGAPEILPEYDDGAWLPTSIETSPLAGRTQSVDGFTWYRGHFTGAANAVTLYCDQACDVFLNGAQIAALNNSAALNPNTQAAPGSPKTLPLPAHLRQTHNVIAILVEDIGQQRYWETAQAPRGVIAVSLDSNAPIRWRMRRGLSGEHTMQGFPGYADWALVPDDGAAHITWHRATFTINIPDNVEVPLFLYLDQTPSKAYIVLNRQLVGRYWDRRGPQHRFWLPEGILRRKGENELLIAQWTRGARPGIGDARLEHGAVMRWYTS